MKSWKRVPTPMTRSAFSETTLALSAPVTPDRAEIQTMVPGKRRLAGLRLDDGDLVLLDKGLQRVGGARKMHTATGDDDRVLRSLQRRNRCFEFHDVGLRTTEAPGFLAKKLSG